MPAAIGLVSNPTPAALSNRDVSGSRPAASTSMTPFCCAAWTIWGLPLRVGKGVRVTEKISLMQSGASNRRSVAVPASPASQTTRKERGVTSVARKARTSGGAAHAAGARVRGPEGLRAPASRRHLRAHGNAGPRDIRQVGAGECVGRELDRTESSRSADDLEGHRGDAHDAEGYVQARCLVGGDACRPRRGPTGSRRAERRTTVRFRRRHRGSATPPGYKGYGSRTSRGEPPRCRR